MHSTSENADIFTTGDEIYLVFAPEKYIFFLFYTQRKYIKHKQTFVFIVSLRFDFCSVFIGYNIGCKRSLLIEMAKNYILMNET